MKIERKKIMLIISVAVLVVVLTLFNGCKKSEPATDTPAITNQEISAPEIPAETTEEVVAEVAAEIEQTMCPVMEGPIDKDIYVEYLGKKVYFCCEGCEEKFMEEPEKYLNKLPQFQE
jgi:YHS domain-containing protein